MRFKTFSAPTMADAMQMVRDDLGADAIILSTERKGSRGVVVTAAVEPSVAPPPDAGAPEDQAAAIGAIGAIDAIGSALERQRVPPMTAQGLLDAAADGLEDEAPVEALAAALAARFDFAPLFPNGDTQRPLMLVGPPGSGKTVTLAKLATLARLGGVPAAAIACDTVRAGAVEQLATYARLLDMPLEVAGTPAALGSAVASFAGSGPVLIDTVGTNSLDADAMDQLYGLADAAGADIMLVLASGGDAAECAEQAAAFAAIGATLLFGTRIDAARRLGGLLAAAEAGPLAIAGFGVSPQIGAGARSADAAFLARLLMPPAAAAPQEAGRAQGRDPR